MPPWVTRNVTWGEPMHADARKRIILGKLVNVADTGCVGVSAPALLKAPGTLIQSGATPENGLLLLASIAKVAELPAFAVWTMIEAL